MGLPAPLDLTGKVAIVTGASQGIGRGIAVCLARWGAQVTLAARNVERLQETARLVEQAGGESCLAATDVTKSDEVDRMVDATLERFGRIDILVNNAGIVLLRPLTEISENEWQRVFDTNVTAIFLCCRRVGKHFIAQQSGKVVNIASQWGFIGVRDASAYCSSKGAVVQLTRSLAVEWARHNINVNAVAPGYTATEMNEEARGTDELRERILRQIPLKRFGEVDEAAQTVAYLCGEAANFITGQTVVVDGGQIVT